MTSIKNSNVVFNLRQYQSLPAMQFFCGMIDKPTKVGHQKHHKNVQTCFKTEITLRPLSHMKKVACINNVAFQHFKYVHAFDFIQVYHNINMLLENVYFCNIAPINDFICFVLQRPKREKLFLAKVKKISLNVTGILETVTSCRTYV